MFARRDENLIPLLGGTAESPLSFSYPHRRSTINYIALFSQYRVQRCHRVERGCLKNERTTSVERSENPFYYAERVKERNVQANFLLGVQLRSKGCLNSGHRKMEIQYLTNIRRGIPLFAQPALDSTCFELFTSDLCDITAAFGLPVVPEVNCILLPK